MYISYYPLFILLLSVFLTACNGNSVRQSQPVDNFEMLYASHYWGEDNDILQKAIDNFETINDVTIYLEPSNFVAKDTGTQIAAGLGPDMIIGIPYEQIIPMTQAGLLKDLNQYEIDQSNYVTEHIRALTYDGKLYGLPFMGTTSILFYNKQQVQRMPTNLAELLEEANSNRGIGISTNFADLFWGIQAFGGSVVGQDGALAVTAESYANWFNWLKDAQGLPGIVLDNDAEFLAEKFVRGEMAYLIAPISKLRQFRELLGEETVGVAPLPGLVLNAGDDTSDTQLISSAGPLFSLQVIAFSQAADEQTVRLGLELAKFLNNPTIQRKLVLAETGRAPTNFKVFVRPGLSEVGNVMIRQSRTSIVVPLDNLNGFNRLSSSADALYLDLLDGNTAPQDAAEQLADLIINSF